MYSANQRIDANDTKCVESLFVCPIRQGFLTIRVCDIVSL